MVDKKSLFSHSAKKDVDLVLKMDTCLLAHSGHREARVRGWNRLSFSKLLDFAFLFRKLALLPSLSGILLRHEVYD